MSKLVEHVQANVVNAPVLFIGCGGIGCKIIKGVADRALSDDNSLLRFICMDTDVNDILNVDKSANIKAIQTSSTATIETYLKNDKDAKNSWFPENKMLDSKPVSEGAGQVRAISRLAMSAVIKEGRIIDLYSTIDELFLKDGGKYKQAIKVVIASTVAGGTGSGIAMEVAMLVRHYINKMYPEAAVMIRGFLVMPGVMDTVIDTQSERDSLRANGYATIKEINAFMMKGSGFFDTVPELKRYKDLCISVPSATSGIEKISCLPFDFCFLMDRTDLNSGNMISLDQYIKFSSQAIYEQNIGPMYKTSSSKEDNVLKLCIRPESLGRCRFGGIGASKLVYPYNAIRSYIARNWVRAAIIGTSSDENLSAEDKERLIKNSWLQYDIQFKEQLKEYEENPASGDEPRIEDVYVEAMYQGKEESAGNNFTSSLWNKYLNLKINETKDSGGLKSTETSPDADTILDDLFSDVDSSMQKIMKFYVASIVKEVLDNRLRSFDSSFNTNYSRADRNCDSGYQYTSRYSDISKIHKLSLKDDVSIAASALAKAIFYSKSSTSKPGLGSFMLEKFVSANGKVMHPNAIRFMLYELKKFLLDARERFNSGSNDTAYRKKIKDIISGAEDNKVKYDVAKTHFKKENTLSEMCDVLDDKEIYGSDQDAVKCNNHLGTYYKTVCDYLICKIGASICEVAIPAVDSLIDSFKKFFDSFSAKVPMIEKSQEDILTSITYKNGDYIYNLFGNKEVIDRLAKSIDRPADSGEAASALYAEIFESVRDNSYIQIRKSANSLDFEKTKDIFDDVLIPYYEKMVEENAEIINVEGILQAIKLEYQVKTSLEIAKTSPACQDAKRRELLNEENMKKYISNVITKCENLASPGIKKNTQDESRESNAIARSVALVDGGGIRVSDFLSGAIASDTVSAYELRFFRSVYNITPLQLSKFAAPSEEGIDDQFELSSEGELDLPSTGDYFRIYQKYMDTIGPDSKTSAVITPHIDQRWNAISVLPELDMDYQKKLMSKIHKSLIYGFVYDRIKMRPISDDNEDQSVYVYYDNDEIKQEMKVSNGTRCDELYEVLDCLYFDRIAVSEIRNFVNAIRVKIKERGCKSIEDSDFFKAASKLTRKKIFNSSQNIGSDVISLFEIVLLYCNSLPAQCKDENEMRVMVNCIIEIVQSEIKSFTSNIDTVVSRTADELLKQYKLFVDSYKKYNNILRNGIFSDDVVETAHSALIHYFKEQDMMKYVDKLREMEEV